MKRRISILWNKIIHRNRGGLNFRRSRKKIDTGKIKWLLMLLVQTSIVVGLAYLCVISFGHQIMCSNASMEPTYTTGDIVLVDVLSYRYFEPDTNDIIVFKPRSNSTAGYSVKRIVGVPGDTVSIVKGRLLINGEVFNDSIKTELITDAGRVKNEITVGEGEYFVLGDNRNLSEDSRYETIGNIQKDDILGKVWTKYPF